VSIWDRALIGFSVHRHARGLVDLRVQKRRRPPLSLAEGGLRCSRGSRGSAALSYRPPACARNSGRPDRRAWEGYRRAFRLRAIPKCTTTLKALGASGSLWCVSGIWISSASSSLQVHVLWLRASGIFSQGDQRALHPRNTSHNRAPNSSAMATKTQSLCSETGGMERAGLARHGDLGRTS